MKRLMNLAPSKPVSRGLAILPFVLLLLIYVFASEQRLAENSEDKLLPSLQKMGTSIHRLAFTPSVRTGEYVFWEDTYVSLRRLGIAVGISALLSLSVGIFTGTFPYANALWTPCITAFSMIPPMTVLPILFILFGLEELSKIVLIIFGIAPFQMRDLHQRVQELPKEQLIKAQTLGATSWQVICRVILPQILPRLLDTIRLSLGAAWIFLIASEAIASDSGLGYRIFLVRRYLSMEIIIPYVIWITFLAFMFDWLIRINTRYFFSWYGSQKS